MIAFLKKHKAFLIGLVITRILTLILSYKGVILIDNEEILTNVELETIFNKMVLRRNEWKVNEKGSKFKYERYRIIHTNFRNRKPLGNQEG
jgi:hypothetical protein